MEFYEEQLFVVCLFEQLTTLSGIIRLEVQRAILFELGLEINVCELKITRKKIKNQLAYIYGIILLKTTLGSWNIRAFSGCPYL